ncbi:ROK family protein [Pseudonocardiaceae bacterium YIM PH 21723]|nr:ROK family protein [Pseudonocardiaceae bacterium YIM PH 21723]
MDRHVLAIDVGGTKIAAALITVDGDIVARAVRPTPTGDADTVFDALTEAVREVLASGVEPVGVGIACAGPVNPEEGTVSPINILGWVDFPLAARVRRLLAPGLPVKLAGDGICMALGEHWRGAGQGSRHMLGIVVSTGIGGGMVIDGKPFNGHSGNAGHIGHVIVEPDGRRCPCGGFGCVETVAAGGALVRWALRHGWRAPEDADAKMLAELAAAGDPIARSAFARGGRAVGLAIIGAAAVVDLEMVVIGGGVANSGALLLDPIRRTVKEHAGLRFLHDLRIEGAELGGEAGLIGAAALIVTAL